MPPAADQHTRTLAALRVRQWLPEWEQVRFDDDLRREPPHHFYMFSMSASSLRVLCGVERRTTRGGTRRADDLRIQRGHDEDRSNEIARFVKHGFPYSTLGKAQRKQARFDDVKQPGWLPTSIVVNIRSPEQLLPGRKLPKSDLVSVEDHDDGTATVKLPHGSDESGWAPRDLEPIEVIDGQHRLFAFDPGDDEQQEFDFPVVAFVGLARSWQAYLFWTINIKPKRINASLAYDLYPLLRNQSWLQRFEGPVVYRETRAQELTELLWAHQKSPWYRRIDMLGDREEGRVRQAAWIRSLTSTLIKAYSGRGVRGTGGLFGAAAGEDELMLQWTREQQAAFLIYAWQRVESAVKESNSPWAEFLRSVAEEDVKKGKPQMAGDPAFTGVHTLLNSDQGVRGVLYAINDVCWVGAEELSLADWQTGSVSETSDEKLVSALIRDIDKQPVAKVLQEIAKPLASFDWRSAGSPSLDEDARVRAAAYRGSGGYREVRRQLLRHISSNGVKRVSRLANKARETADLE